MFDASFWVAIAFFLFVLLLVFKKVPQIVLGQIDNKINELKNKINEAEELKSNSEKLLSEAKSKLEKSDEENSNILAKAQKISDDEISASLEKMKISLEIRKSSSK